MNLTRIPVLDEQDHEQNVTLARTFVLQSFRCNDDKLSFHSFAGYELTRSIMDCAQLLYYDRTKRTEYFDKLI